MKDTTCEGCIFASPIINEYDEPVMKCRRFPPTLWFDPESAELTQTFPDAHLRCGEYKRDMGPSIFPPLTEWELP